MPQLYLNNFQTQFIADVRAAPQTGAPASELDYGVLRVSDGAAGTLLNPPAGGWYVLTAYKRSGSLESDYEILRVTAVDNSVIGECRLTVLRGQEGTAPRAYVAGDLLEMRITAGGMREVVQTSDARMSNPRAPTGAAGGVLAGQFPNPTFAQPMALAADLLGKVDKVSGKGLSANDFSDEAAAKLGGVATGATKNATDAQLRDRSTHTGTQAIETVAGLQTALEASKQFANLTGKPTTTTGYGISDALTSKPILLPAGTDLNLLPDENRIYDGFNFKNGPWGPDMWCYLETRTHTSAGYQYQVSRLLIEESPVMERRKMGASGFGPWRVQSAFGVQPVAGGGTGAATPAAARQNLSVRQYASSALTLYVRTDGVDTNSGFEDSPEGAFKTLAKAMEVVNSIDMSMFGATIKVGPGIFAGVNVAAYSSFSSVLTIEGAGSNLTRLEATGGKAAISTVYCQVVVKNLTVAPSTGTTDAYLVIMDHNSLVTFSNVTFGRSGIAVHTMLFVSNGSNAVLENVSVVGSFLYGFYATNSGRIYSYNKSVSFVSANCTNTFLVAIVGSSIMWLNIVVNGGLSSGTKFYLTSNSVLNLGGAGGSIVPGGSVGQILSGSQAI
ncbi:right-handed parallel beta-helix repeat-containing protein [Delftia lacustris]|uniref:right-handed parallel beta-helix repeat-containing protein n=1 Tax=Delftia lacustris TaxID=558537 RepID=UPI00285A781C|nr:right-handed parallel beta-helix repeat-containing protein [Delftia lacustris]MDR6729334.1 hypothetical protein [Delftia lacustris]